MLSPGLLLSIWGFGKSNCRAPLFLPVLWGGSGNKEILEYTKVSQINLVLTGSSEGEIIPFTGAVSAGIRMLPGSWQAPLHQEHPASQASPFLINTLGFPYFLGKPAQPVKRELLRHRDYKVDLESKLGKTIVITKTTPQSEMGG